jgi:hypothetical protein
LVSFEVGVSLYKSVRLYNLKRIGRTNEHLGQELIRIQRYWRQNCLKLFLLEDRSGS